MDFKLICVIFIQMIFLIKGDKEINVKVSKSFRQLQSFCPDGQFYTGQNCQNCISDCKQCNNYSTCISCNDSYYLMESSSQCTLCPQDGYFKQDPQKICKICHYTCQQCYGILNTQCKICSDGSQNTNTQTCELCNLSCKTCNNGNTNGCTSCRSDKYLLDGYCITCQDDGVFIDKYNQCQHCDQSCIKCSQSSTNCQSCKDGYYQPYQDQPCCPCQTPCKTCNGLRDQNCLSCLDGYYLESNTCKQCDSSCYKCTGPTNQNCESCNAGFDKVNNQCIKCDSSCKKCKGTQNTDCTLCQDKLYLSENNQCISCKVDGQFISLDRCLQCSSTCKTCSEQANKCITCPNYYYLTNSNECVPCTGDNFYISVDRCLPCDQSCRTCNGDKNNNCLSCNNQLYLSKDKTCIQCDQDKQFKQDQMCKDCNPSCQKCSGTENYCTQCVQGLYLSSDNQCVKCNKPGQYISNGKCIQCDQSCTKCDERDNSKCIECVTNNAVYVMMMASLYPKHNVQNVMQLAQDAQGQHKMIVLHALLISIQMKSGYYISDNKCIQCHKNCRSCDGELEADCLSCNFGLIFQPTFKKCDKCEEGSFLNNSTNKCEYCDETCLKCTGINKNQCTICTTGLDLSKITNTCEDSTKIQNENNKLEYIQKLGCLDLQNQPNQNCIQRIETSQSHTQILNILSIINLVLVIISSLFTPIGNSLGQIFIQNCQIVGNYIFASKLNSYWMNQLELKTYYAHHIATILPTFKQSSNLTLFSFQTFNTLISVNDFVDSYLSNCFISVLTLGIIAIITKSELEKLDLICMVISLSLYIVLQLYWDIKIAFRYYSIQSKDLESIESLTQQVEISDKFSRVFWILFEQKKVLITVDNKSFRQLLPCPDGKYGAGNILTGCKDCLDKCRRCDDQSSCKLCFDGFYLTEKNKCVECKQLGQFISNKKCIECDQSCTKCDEMKTSKCFECAQGKYLTIDNKCVECKELGQYIFNQKCIQCDQSCTKCDETDHSKCFECVSGKYLTADNSTCTSNCNTKGGYYISDNKCIKCHKNCRSCDGELEANCLSCNFGLIFQPTFKKCDKCEESSFLNNSTKKCEYCDETCLKCSGINKNECTICIEGLVLSKVTNTCEDSTKIQSEKDELDYIQKLGCIDLQNQPDQNCIQRIETSQSHTQILNILSIANIVLVIISSIFTPIGNSLGQIFLQNCQIVGNYIFASKLNSLWMSQLELKTYYAHHIATILPITFNPIQDANNNIIKSLKLIFQKSLRYISSCILDPEDQPTEQSECTDCKQDGFYVSDKNCMPCDASCKACSINSSICQGCNNGYYQQKENQSCQKCDENCATCDGQGTNCTSCNKDKYLDKYKIKLNQKILQQINKKYRSLNPGNKCQPCDIACDGCTGSESSDCLKCKDGYSLVNSICIKCDSSCQTCSGIDSNQCESCHSNNYLTKDNQCDKCDQERQFQNKQNQKCEECDSSCLKCNGTQKTNCTQCDSNLYLSKNQQCISCDQSGQFIKGNQCFKCHSTCLTCNGATSTDCLSCPKGQYLLVSKSSCTSYCETKKGYFIQGDKCIECHYNCRTCYGKQETNCSSCSFGLVFQPTVNKCDKCEEGMFLNKQTNKCEHCDKDCQICTGPNRSDCQLCREGLVLSKVTNTCEDSAKIQNEEEGLEYYQKVGCLELENKLDQNCIQRFETSQLQTQILNILSVSNLVLIIISSLFTPLGNSLGQIYIQNCQTLGNYIFASKLNALWINEFELKTYYAYHIVTIIPKIINQSAGTKMYSFNNFNTFVSVNDFSDSYINNCCLSIFTLGVIIILTIIIYASMVSKSSRTGNKNTQNSRLFKVYNYIKWNLYVHFFRLASNFLIFNAAYLLRWKQAFEKLELIFMIISISVYTTLQLYWNVKVGLKYYSISSDELETVEGLTQKVEVSNKFSRAFWILFEWKKVIITVIQSIFIFTSDKQHLSCWILSGLNLIFLIYILVKQPFIEKQFNFIVILQETFQTVQITILGVILSSEDNLNPQNISSLSQNMQSIFRYLSFGVLGGLILFQLFMIIQRIYKYILQLSEINKIRINNNNNSRTYQIEQINETNISSIFQMLDNRQNIRKWGEK
ncbi:hypothetical protein ABPG74_020691 [Tetrahymena malaccensis]